MCPECASQKEFRSGWPLSTAPAIFVRSKDAWSVRMCCSAVATPRRSIRWFHVGIYTVYSRTWSVWDMVVMWRRVDMLGDAKIKQGKHIIQMFKPKLRGKCRRVPCHSDVRPHHLIVLSAMPEIGNEIKSMIIQMPCGF